MSTDRRGMTFFLRAFGQRGEAFPTHRHWHVRNVPHTRWTHPLSYQGASSGDRQGLV